MLYLSHLIYEDYYKNTCLITMIKTLIKCSVGRALSTVQIIFILKDTTA